MVFQLRALLISILLILSSLLTTLAVSHNHYFFTLCSILIFCCPILLVSYGSFLLLEDDVGSSSKNSLLHHGISRNTLLTGLVYAWGSLTLLSIYTFSGLSWRHGIQYGIASGLIALFLCLYWYYAQWDPEDLSFKKMLVCIHAGLLLMGLFYFLSTGKLMSQRGDWAANFIFLSGGITLLTICFVTLRCSQNSLWSSKIKTK